MEITDLLPLFSQDNIVNFFFKAFALLFSFMYFFYAIIVFRQSFALNRSLESPTGGLIQTLTGVQIVFAIGLIAIAFFV